MDEESTAAGAAVPASKVPVAKKRKMAMAMEKGTGDITKQASHEASV